METIFTFALLGAAAGALYAISAMGIVVTYRGSGTVNFASGAIGMVGAFVYWEISGTGAPLAIAAVVGVLASSILSYLAYLMVRHTAGGSHMSQVVLTIILLATIEAAMELKYSPAVSYAAPSLLRTSSVDVLGVHVGEDRLILIGIAALATAAVFAVYRYTRFGLATSAVAENPESAAVVGWSANRIAAINWLLGGALAGLATILICPIVGLQTGLATSLLVPTLAAAVVGGLRSFPLTLVGGLGLGVIQAEVQRYVSFQGLSAAVPFFVIAAVIVVRGRSLPLRSYVGERLPKVTSGRVRWVPLLIATVASAALIEWVLPVSWVEAVTTTLIGAIAVISLVVVTGFAGQVSLAQWAVAGLGAYLFTRLVEAGVGFEAATLLTLLSGVPIGVAIGAISVRARGISLAIASLGLGSALVTLILNNPTLDGAGAGLPLGNFHLFGVALDDTLYPQRFSIVCLLAFILVGVATANIRRGGIGRRLLSVRANERAAASLGISVPRTKLAASCYASVVAMLAGIFVAARFPVVLLNAFDTLTSLNLLSQGVLGGIGYASAPLIGAQGQPGSVVSTALQNAAGPNAYQYLAVAVGASAILVVMQSPDGLLPFNAELGKALVRRLLRKPAAVAAVTPLVAASGTVAKSSQVSLEIVELTVRMGGVTAVDGVNLRLEGGQVVGVIGPNGAGKTTLIDAITGFVRPRAGRIMLDGRELTRLSAAVRAKHGIARSFQSLELFEDLTIYENLATACDAWHPARWLTEVVRPRRAAVNASAAAAAKEFELWEPEVLARYPHELSHGKRRLVAIARSVASNPRVLLLDEPAVGLGIDEREELKGIIRRLADEQGYAVLLVEHDLDLVCAVSDTLVALDHGAVIAEGSPEQVRRDPTVIESYIGAEPAPAPMSETERSATAEPQP
jgi:ABC-type branched-subunit amino acid transport system ATPase component/branched-subunit amino acid ABC-type transport system permease component